MLIYQSTSPSYALLSGSRKLSLVAEGDERDPEVAGGVLSPEQKSSHVRCFWTGGTFFIVPRTVRGSVWVRMIIVHQRPF